jgi:large subunit ribosomal protein L15
MKLHELSPAPGSKREKRRIGRGHGSGRVKTSGRGTKGQNSRAGGGTRLGFEGGQNPWTMRVPHKRGFSRNRFKIIAQVVNLRDLETAFSAGDTVSLDLLKERGLIDDVTGARPVKVLGDGTLSKALTLEVHAVSASAREAVEQAGGTLALLPGKPKPEKTKRKKGPRAPRAAAAGVAAAATEAPASAAAGEAPSTAGGAEAPPESSPGEAAER